MNRLKKSDVAKLFLSLAAFFYLLFPPSLLPNPSSFSELRTLCSELLHPVAQAADDTWSQALGPWQWSFPRDHGSHPQYRTEWWYFTGNLTDAAGHAFGYQLTFFRQGLRRSRQGQGSWSVTDVYLAHFAITDEARGRFFHIDKASRRGPGLAGAAEGAMDVHLLNWSARMEGKRIRLKATHKEMELSLTLVPGKPLVLHGENGLSRKGPKPGQASYYYSFTELLSEGKLKVPGLPKPLTVKGVSWFDQEFGSNQLSADQVGWDWFGLHLSDGRDLMIYFLRKEDGTLEATSSGTLVEKDGRPYHLNLSSLRVTVQEQWKSPRTNAFYPSKWRIEIPSAQIDFVLAPVVPDQELITAASTGITYWEGAVKGTGTSKGKSVSVYGYSELTGYAGSLGGVF